MPRTSTGPKLWFDKARQRWTISDGKSKRRTNCRRDEIEAAKAELAKYIAEHHTVDSSSKVIADILMAYIDEVITGKVSEPDSLMMINRVNAWWGAKLVADITHANCKAYAKHRGDKPIVRSELGYLRAALKHWHKNHSPILIPTITMPPRPAARERWLTRSEAARFLWAARRTPHLTRFFIIGWYTGSRRTVILRSKWSLIKLDDRIMYRKPPGTVQTKKRAPPLRIGNRLLGHLRRWKKKDGKHDLLIRFAGRNQGEAIKQIDRTWHSARIKAGLSDDVTPHVLRHSRATHLMRQGIDPWEAAQFLGMSLKMLETTYGHHRPSWQTNAADAK
jgi:integrase